MELGGPLAQTTLKNNQAGGSEHAAGPRAATASTRRPRRSSIRSFDAIFTAAQSLATVDPKRRRVLYVISDGKEYGSKVKEKELIHYLQTNKVQVYATLVGDSSMPGMGFLDRIHLPLTMRDDALPRIAYATGGQTILSSVRAASRTALRTSPKTVRTEYTVGYYTHANPLDGRFRSLEIRVMRPNLTVIAPRRLLSDAAQCASGACRSRRRASRARSRRQTSRRSRRHAAHHPPPQP